MKKIRKNMTWNEIIKNEEKQDYFRKLEKEIDLKYKNSVVFPKKDKIYAAFDYTAFEDVKVVILGQDPYHGANQAQGLSFSTPKEIKNPPSMKNILKEIEDDMKRVSICEDGNLIPWAKDGVLLLNTILTVEESKPKSHHKLGWETFTENIIKTISEELKGVVFILWGANAIKQEKLINTDVHHILKGVHPSPLSSYRGFFGSKVFSKTNELLKKEGKKEITW
ncbi:MAG: uracil-DNA glycosylase [Campylobacteraceae bacterium]|nr:uracil-DNA glycosylase [Campylobacteraceae bacterium]